MQSDKPYTKLNLELLEKVIKELAVDMPYMEQIAPGLWKISSGGKNPMIMWTGDRGADDFRKAMGEQAKLFV